MTLVEARTQAWDLACIPLGELLARRIRLAFIFQLLAQDIADRLVGENLLRTDVRLLLRFDRNLFNLLAHSDPLLSLDLFLILPFGGDKAASRVVALDVIEDLALALLQFPGVLLFHPLLHQLFLLSERQPLELSTHFLEIGLLRLVRFKELLLGSDDVLLVLNELVLLKLPLFDEPLLVGKIPFLDGFDLLLEASLNVFQVLLLVFPLLLLEIQVQFETTVS
mmetsp:Transcript_1804/g.2392  ORF Transcript_1804/g.2392 Transcript_1804/m.2392 type:complete len:223 (-) Transcript_1804:2269-2937(-)